MYIGKLTFLLWYNIGCIITVLYNVFRNICFGHRLFTYPPAPATGGMAVTNEDFYCLNDGEFLNDVIIDFYLK